MGTPLPLDSNQARWGSCSRPRAQLAAKRSDPTCCHSGPCLKRALLVAGGINPALNYPRYLNDLILYHRLLSSRHGYSPADIRLLSGPGGSADLSGTGQVEPFLPATRLNIEAGLTWLASLGPGDMAFFLASNHGAPQGLCCWGVDLITPQQLSAVLGPSMSHKILVFGQCHAGIFGHLQPPYSITCCACGPAEPSYSSPNGQYDEFLLQFATALSVAGVTIAAAFSAAAAADSEPETPAIFDPFGLANSTTP